MKYKVSEIFYSIQGEGVHTGQPTVFIRMAGCSMKCSFCDTKYSWRKAKTMSIESILKELQKYPCDRITITGGEPFEQDMIPLVRALISDYRVYFETNGSKSIPAEISAWCWVTVSPKKKVLAINLNRACEVKMLVNSLEDIKRSERLGAFCSPATAICLQPVSMKPENIRLCVEAIKRNPRLRLSLQTHKYSGVR